MVKDVEVGIVWDEAELNSTVPAQALEAGIGVALVFAVFIVPLLVNVAVPPSINRYVDISTVPLAVVVNVPFMVTSEVTTVFVLDVFEDVKLL